MSKKHSEGLSRWRQKDYWKQTKLTKSDYPEQKPKKVK